MNHGPEYVREEAIRAAAHRLRKAALFAEFNIKNPLFQKRMGKGETSVLVRLEWPGVLRVVDPETGEVLAESEAGRPDILWPCFVPSVPALSGSDQERNLRG